MTYSKPGVVPLKVPGIRVTYLLILLLDLCLHLLQLLLAFIRTHPQPLSQHAYTKDGKQSGGHVVRVDSRDDGGGIAKQHWGGRVGVDTIITSLLLSKRLRNNSALQFCAKPKYPILPTRETSHESQGQHGTCQHCEAVVTHGHDGCNEKCLVSQLRDDDDRDGGHEGVDETQVSFAGLIFRNYWAHWMGTWSFLQKESNTATVSQVTVYNESQTCTPVSAISILGRHARRTLIKM